VRVAAVGRARAGGGRAGRAWGGGGKISKFSSFLEVFIFLKDFIIS